MISHKVWRMASMAIVMIGTLGACTGLLREDGPNKLAETLSLGDIIQQADAKPVHIIFVHGMRATGRGGSAKFRDGICKYVKDGCHLTESVLGMRFDLDACPEDATVNGVRIWKCTDDWPASRPFVDRFVLSRPHGGNIIVDEVNWWPLLFPLKCRALLVDDAKLAGPDEAALNLCASRTDPYYPWLSKSDVDQMLATRPKSGGGAHFNKLIKQNIMDWGLADAVIAVGPMRKYIHAAMNAAFNYANSARGDADTGEIFVVVSESLGSFAVLDTFQASSGLTSSMSKPEATAVRDVLDRSSYLYFFANQIGILDFARIKNIKPERKNASGEPAPESPLPSPYDALSAWGSAGGATKTLPPLKQIVSFSDPSDLLTFYVPAIRDKDKNLQVQTNVKVVNVYDYNGFTWFGLFENPLDAHTGHSGNDKVLRQMFTISNRK